MTVAPQTTANEAPPLTWVTNKIGEFELRKPCGDVIAQILFWPFPKGDWLTIKPPEDWRDCGMKRFKTVKGAKTYLTKKFRISDEIPVEVSA